MNIPNQGYWHVITGPDERGMYFYTMYQNGKMIHKSGGYSTKSWTIGAAQDHKKELMRKQQYGTKKD